MAGEHARGTRYTRGRGLIDLGRQTDNRFSDHANYTANPWRQVPDGAASKSATAKAGTMNAVCRSALS